MWNEWMVPHSNTTDRKKTRNELPEINMCKYVSIFYKKQTLDLTRIVNLGVNMK